MPHQRTSTNARAHWSPNKTAFELGTHLRLNEPLSLHPFNPHPRCLVVVVKEVFQRELQLIDNQLPIQKTTTTYIQGRERYKHNHTDHGGRLCLGTINT